MVWCVCVCVCVCVCACVCVCVCVCVSTKYMLEEYTCTLVYIICTAAYTRMLPPACRWQKVCLYVHQHTLLGRHAPRSCSPCPHTCAAESTRYMLAAPDCSVAQLPRSCRTSQLKKKKRRGLGRGAGGQPLSFLEIGCSSQVRSLSGKIIMGMNGKA